MKIKLEKQLIVPFLFTLFIGSLGVITTLLVFEGEIAIYLRQLTVGLVVGIGLGLGVYLIEKLNFLRHSVKQNATSQYRTTSLWKYVLLILVILQLTFKGEARGIITGIWGFYLLTLAFIIFRMRESNGIRIV